MSTIVPSSAGRYVSFNVSLNDSDRVSISGFPPVPAKSQNSVVASSKHSSQMFATSTGSPCLRLSEHGRQRSSVSIPLPMYHFTYWIQGSRHVRKCIHRGDPNELLSCSHVALCIAS